MRSKLNRRQWTWMFCTVFGIAMVAVATAEEGLLPWGTKASTPTPATVQASGNTVASNQATPASAPAPPSLSAPKLRNPARFVARSSS